MKRIKEVLFCMMVIVVQCTCMAQSFSKNELNWPVVSGNITTIVGRNHDIEKADQYCRYRIKANLPVLLDLQHADTLYILEEIPTYRVFARGTVDFSPGEGCFGEAPMMYRPNYSMAWKNHDFENCYVYLMPQDIIRQGRWTYMVDDDSLLIKRYKFSSKRDYGLRMVELCTDWNKKGLKELAKAYPDSIQKQYCDLKPPTLYLTRVIFRDRKKYKIDYFKFQNFYLETMSMDLRKMVYKKKKKMTTSLDGEEGDSECTDSATPAGDRRTQPVEATPTRSKTVAPPKKKDEKEHVVIIKMG